MPDDLLGQAAASSGIDADYLARVMRIESGGNPNARTGSYRGLFQLSPSEFNKYGGGNIYNAADNARAFANKQAQENAAFRARYGRDPTPGESYLIHQQGAGGYHAHVSSPNELAWRNMATTAEGQQKGAGWARQAIWGNVPDNLKRQYGSVDNITSQQFMDLWRNKVEGGAPATFDERYAAASAPSPATADYRSMVARAARYANPAAQTDLQWSPMQIPRFAINAQ
jgi:hypothetical protein